jgi:hypothetical protein
MRSGVHWTGALEASHPLLGSAKAWGTRKINVEPNANRRMGHPPSITVPIPVPALILSHGKVVCLLVSEITMGLQRRQPVHPDREGGCLTGAKT